MKEITGGRPVAMNISGGRVEEDLDIVTAGYAKLDLGCVFCRSCESGKCPTGITTQDPALRRRLDVDERAEQVENLLRVSTNEPARLARLCGCDDVFDLGPEQMRLLSLVVSRAISVEMAYEPQVIDGLHDFLESQETQDDEGY